MNKEILTVNGIKCNHCKKAMEDTLLALPGVLNAKINLETKKVIVEFDE